MIAARRNIESQRAVSMPVVGRFKPQSLKGVFNASCAQAVPVPKDDMLKVSGASLVAARMDE